MLNEKQNKNCMQSQYSVRMLFLSIDGVCVWDNTHKSWFLESLLMMDVLSVCLCTQTCQENLEPAFFPSPVQMCMQKSFDKIPLDDCRSNEGNLCCRPGLIDHYGVIR